MNHKINKIGLEHIKQFLMKNHPFFQDREPNQECLAAWATEAEQHANDENGCYIEISNFESVYGRTQIFEIPDDGYTVKNQEGE